MNWGAVAWATDSQIGYPAAKFILILLANKADENFSCYTSIRTLTAESDAGRSTVLRALKDLETRGWITRQPQFHDSGARRSNRYYLNHPLAPHLSPGPDPEPSRPNPGRPSPDPRRTPSCPDTGTVSARHPTGVPQRDPLDPSNESSSEPGDTTAAVLAALTEAWELSTRQARSLLPAVESALADGWPATQLTEHLVDNTAGANDPVRVLARRLGAPPPLPQPRPTAVAWCGECEDEHSRTINLTTPDGSEVARFCPQCSPQFHRDRLPAGQIAFDYGKVVNYLGEQRVQ